jgi:hypothetical protein
MQVYSDSPYKTFTAEVPADLVGKEGYLVQLVATKNTIELFNGGLAIGVLQQRLQGSSDWTVRLLGKGGTVKVVQDGAIAVGGRVKAANGGKVTPLGASGRSLGIKLSPAANGANNDVIELIDVVEVIA